MKNRIPPGAVIALVAIALIACVLAYKAVSNHAPSSVSEDTLKKYMEKKNQDPWIQQMRSSTNSNTKK